MALLDAAQRFAIRALFLGPINEQRAAFGLTKAQLQAAIDATDQWIEDNAATYNQALPPAARNGLTAAQKLALFFCVASKRYTG